MGQDPPLGALLQHASLSFLYALAAHCRQLQDLAAWDTRCLELDEKYNFISNPWQWATLIDDEKQVGGRGFQQGA